MATRLENLLRDITKWNGELHADVEDWLYGHCARDQLIILADIAGCPYSAPLPRPEPTKVFSRSISWKPIAARAVGRLASAQRKENRKQRATLPGNDCLNAAARPTHRAGAIPRPVRRLSGVGEVHCLDPRSGNCGSPPISAISRQRSRMQSQKTPS